MPARLRLLGVLLSLSVVLVTPRTAGGAQGTVEFSTTYETAGLSIGVPAGWRVLHGRRTPCTNPVERLTLAGNGALVHLQEYLAPLVMLPDLPPRPHRFTLTGEPSWPECCPPAAREGWVIPFRDGRRAFFAYLYPDRGGSGAAAVAVLESLVVSARA